MATTPVVHPWMRQDPQRVRDLVSQLDGHLGRLEEARRRTAPLCPALAPPATPGVDAREHPLDDLCAALYAARDAFGALAGALELHGASLAQAHERLVATGLRHRRIRALRAEIRGYTDALSRADVECRRALEAGIRRVPPGSVLARLAVPQVSVEVDPTDARALRSSLRTAPSSQVAGLLAARPEAAEALTAAGATDLQLLPGPIAAASSLGRKDPVDDSAQRLATIEKRRAALELAGDPAVTAAMLWPSVFGSLDGAPVAARVAANRILLRTELGRARRADVELEVRAIARRAVDGQRWWRCARAQLLRAWLTRDRLTSFVTTRRVDLPGLLRHDLRVRIRLYQGLLYDPVIGVACGIRAPRPSPDHAQRARPAVRGRRRLLLFDPGGGSGRGRLAELWGTLDEHTGAVAVFVPGTGTAVRGFHMPTQVARDLAEAAAPAEAPGEASRDAGGGGTAVIAWMGADFPLAIGTHALFARFALAAAPALLDFVAGLPMPTGAPLTVLGHSYGGTIIGAAESVGLRADRVVHIASPGAGPGVRGAADYPVVDPLGRPRRPVRFALTAPGDPIVWAQRFEAPWWVVPDVLRRRLRRWGAGLSLGVDPARLAGVRLLAAGAWEVDGPGHRAGDPVVGPAAHAAVTARGTQAFRRLVEVVGAPL
ncbi:MAG: alpha/beta hydrolase [Micrococcales bacterium]|nr:alpha/beta hydrolase [Micrococcales bacterium]